MWCSAYEIDLATRPNKVVLNLLSCFSFQKVNHLFSFSPKGELENKNAFFPFTFNL